MSSEPQPQFFIEKLRRDHDLSAFDCGNSTFTTWLQRFAWSNQQADSAKTYVACQEKRVVGYYTLTTGSVHKHETPERVAKGLANHPIGVVLLARLAVDVGEQGKGLGKALLIDALERVEEAADIVVFRLSWKWRRRSPVKITERTLEKNTQTLHHRREGRHIAAPFA
jgi:GNAT superfamily N-acetyltransferase